MFGLFSKKHLTTWQEIYDFFVKNSELHDTFTLYFSENDKVAVYGDSPMQAYLNPKAQYSWGNAITLKNTGDSYLTVEQLLEYIQERIDNDGADAIGGLSIEADVTKHFLGEYTHTYEAFTMEGEFELRNAGNNTFIIDGRIFYQGEPWDSGVGGGV